MQQIIILFHMIIAFCIIALVLLQQGKGATAGASFGGGASGTIFGSRGPASFMMKLTGAMAILFFVTSLTLGYMAGVQSKQADKLNAPPPVPSMQTTPQQSIKQVQPKVIKRSSVSGEPKSVNQAPKSSPKSISGSQSGSK